ncbi:hypothetical protein FOZ61_006143 [Perkinsus olseni]|uniref:Laminin subunit alpha-2 n=1 Tax=Perkinsus olseni TaxID=32597 RepID=A0A7J6LQE1_PEROL|nr:hypothetical protein FOZ61_006143 [Perkinsus olseni]KAF4661525.1 hypothetical protein FOL46_005686 [Perkinsus olseni]
MLIAPLWGLLASLVLEASALATADPPPAAPSFNATETRGALSELIPLDEIPDRIPENLRFLMPRNCTEGEASCLPHRKAKVNRMYNQMLYLLKKSQEAFTRLGSIKGTVRQENLTLGGDGGKKLTATLEKGVNLLQKSTRNSLTKSARIMTEIEKNMGSEVKRLREWFSEISQRARDGNKETLQQSMEHMLEASEKMRAIAESTGEITRVQRRFPLRAARVLKLSREVASRASKGTQAALHRTGVLGGALSHMEEEGMKRQRQELLYLLDRTTKQYGRAAASLASFRQRRSGEELKRIRQKAASFVKRGRMLDEELLVKGKELNIKRRLRRSTRISDTLLRGGLRGLARDVSGLSSDLDHVATEGKKGVSRLASKEKEMIVGRTATATAVDSAIKSQLSGFESAEAELNRAVRAADKTLMDDMGKELDGVIKETSKFETTTGGVQRRADAETKHIRKDAQQAMHLAEEQEQENLLHGKQMAEATGSLQESGERDLRGEIGRRVDAAEHSIAAMGGRVDAAMSVVKRGLAETAAGAAKSEIQNSLGVLESELSQDIALMNDQITGSVERGVDSVRERQAHESSEQNRKMKNLRSAITEGASSFARDAASFNQLDEAHKNKLQGLDGRAAESRRNIREIESGIGSKMLVLASLRDKAGVTHRREVDADLRHQSEEGKRAMKESAESRMKELRGSMEALASEMRAGRTGEMILDREVSKVAQDVDRAKTDGLKLATELEARLHSLLSRSVVNDEAMLSGLQTRRRSLLESTRSSTATQVASTVEGVSRILGSRITAAEDEVRRVIDENNREEKRHGDIEASLKLSQRRFALMDGSMQRGLAEAGGVIRDLNDSVHLHEGGELIRLQQNRAGDEVASSQMRLEKAVMETSGQVDQQQKALRRLVELLKTAMKNMLEHVSGIVEENRKGSTASSVGAAPARNISAELSRSEADFAARLERTTEGRDDSYRRLRKGVEEILAASKDTERWSNNVLGDERQRLEKLAADSSTEVEGLSSQLEDEKSAYKSAVASEQKQEAETMKAAGGTASERAMRIDGEVEKLMRSLTTHASQLEGLLERNALKISSASEDASTLNTGVNREVEQAEMAMNSPWTRMLENARLTRKHFGQLINESGNALFTMKLPVSEALNVEATAALEDLTRFLHSNLSASLHNTGLDGPVFDETVQAIDRDYGRQRANFRPLHDQMRKSVVELNRQSDIAARSLSTSRQQVLDEIDDAAGSLTASRDSLNHELQQHWADGSRDYTNVFASLADDLP